MQVQKHRQKSDISIRIVGYTNGIESYTITMKMDDDDDDDDDDGIDDDGDDDAEDNAERDSARNRMMMMKMMMMIPMSAKIPLYHCIVI